MPVTNQIPPIVRSWPWSQIKHENKRDRSHQESAQHHNAKKQRARQSVTFANDQNLKRIHYFDPLNGHEDTTENSQCSEEGNECEGSHQQGSKLTAELSLLSTSHGRARRELRDISKHDLQTAMKYGVKTKGNFIKGEQRWKFEFGNTIFITDEHCTKEITCYKKAIQIERANITQTMLENHYEAVRVLKEDPHLVRTISQYFWI